MTARLFPVSAALTLACLCACLTISFGENETSPDTQTASVQDAVSHSGQTQKSERKKDEKLHILRRLGGRVSLVKYSNGSWQLFVDGLPFLVRGIEYSPDRVGVKPEYANEWMTSDINRNGRIDGPYDSYVDANHNNKRDPDEKIVGDFTLLNEMGCNVIRIYHSTNVNKRLLRELYRNYGIYVIMGNFIGAYTVGSGADWEKGTDYSDLQQRKKMKAEVVKMIKDFKDEPYVLMWMLGNENDVCGSYENSTYNNTNACSKPEAYASFLEELCVTIKTMDQDHPVGVCNAGYKLLPYYKKFAPAIDIVGMNMYSGPYGFGVLWNRVKKYFDRPVLITEYGCDAYNLKKRAVDEDFQAQYHKMAWLDIENNSFSGSGLGNSLGGVIFCWLDKWWLCGRPDEHDTDVGAWEGPTQDGYFLDEWMGICGQGDGSDSPFLRQPRKVYYLYKNELWNKVYKKNTENSGNNP